MNGETGLALAGEPLPPLAVCSLPVEFTPGEPLIVCVDADNPRFARAVYHLDAKRRPFQIAGDDDVLMDRHDFEDRTLTHRTSLSLARVLVRAVLESLSLEEMVEHAGVLRAWESRIITVLLAGNVDRPSLARGMTRAAWEETPLPEAMRARGGDALDGCDLRSATGELSPPVAINMEEYERADYGLWRYVA
jgi:hypothetical protein